MHIQIALQENNVTEACEETEPNTVDVNCLVSDNMGNCSTAKIGKYVHRGRACSTG